jgi:predicted double-glycine peptidase
MSRIALGLLLLLFPGRFLQPAPQEKAGVWLDVPFIRQSEDGCGSAAISMVLEYWNAHGARINPQRADSALIQKQLEEQLKQGRPLIVSLQPGSVKAPLHYVVITGIDWQSGAVFIHDPARGKLLRIERAEFEKEWRPNRNWMLLAVPEKAA